MSCKCAGRLGGLGARPHKQMHPMRLLHLPHQCSQCIAIRVQPRPAARRSLPCSASASSSQLSVYQQWGSAVTSPAMGRQPHLDGGGGGLEGRLRHVAGHLDARAHHRRSNIHSRLDHGRHLWDGWEEPVPMSLEGWVNGHY